MCRVKPYPKICGTPNLGGTSDTAFIIAHEDILTWPTLSSGTAAGDSMRLTGTFGLKPTAAWIPLSIISQSGMIDNTLAGVTGSAGFLTEGGFSLAGYSAEQKEFFNSLLNTPAVVVFPDKTGERHVMGDENSPAYLAAEGRIGTGKESGDLRGGELKFTAAMGHMAYSLDAAVLLDTTP